MPSWCAASGSCTASAVAGMSAPPAMLVKCSLQTSKIAAAFIAALLLLVIFWSRKIFTVVMCLIFVAAIIACYFIPNPAGGEIMRYFILFVGYALLLSPVTVDGVWSADLQLDSPGRSMRLGSQLLLSATQKGEC